MNPALAFRSAVVVLCLAVPLALGAGGCSGDDSPPAASPTTTALDAERSGGETAGIGRRDAGLVPLALGSEWHYRGTVRFEIIAGDGSGEVMVIDRDETHTIIGAEIRSGREYRVLEQVIDEHELGVTTQWVRMRQTRLGLYEADVSLNEPPAGTAPAAAGAAAPDAAWDVIAATLREDQQASYRRAWEELRARREAVSRALAAAAAAVPGRDAGADAGELTRLSYPLHPGRSWVILADPEYIAHVEVLDVLETEVGNIPAYRIRIDAEFFSPGDEVRVWYGAIGMAAQEYHVEAIATDEQGDPIGTLVADGRLDLTGTNFTGPKGVQ